MTQDIAKRKSVNVTAGYRLIKALVDDFHQSRRHTAAEAMAGFTSEESRIFAVLLERFVGTWPRNPA